MTQDTLPRTTIGGIECVAVDFRGELRNEYRYQGWGDPCDLCPARDGPASCCPEGAGPDDVWVPVYTYTLMRLGEPLPEVTP
jgi:hypothetical protein